MADVPEPTFLMIVQLHQLQAMLHLGIVPNPATGNPNPVNLPMARRELALLEILHEKTEGNLTEREHHALHEVIETLRRAIDAL